MTAKNKEKWTAGAIKWTTTAEVSCPFCPFFCPYQSLTAFDSGFFEVEGARARAH